MSAGRSAPPIQLACTGTKGKVGRSALESRGREVSDLTRRAGVNSALARRARKRWRVCVACCIGQPDEDKKRNEKRREGPVTETRTAPNSRPDVHGGASRSKTKNDRGLRRDPSCDAWRDTGRWPLPGCTCVAPRLVSTCRPSRCGIPRYRRRVRDDPRCTS